MSDFKYRQAARCIDQGGVIAYPTEAVYGLGCHPLNKKAVFRLLEIKRRPVSKGVILIASDFEQLLPYVDVPTNDILQVALNSWPGPNTWIFPAGKHTPVWLTGSFSSIAVRVTAHPVASKLCEQAGTALVSTSANVSSRPPARSAMECHLRCPGFDCLLSGAVNKNSQPSKIRDLLSGKVIRA